MRRGRTFAIRISLLALAVSVFFALAGCAEKKTITVGSKDYTGNIILGELFAQLVEAKTDIRVERKLNMGGTAECFEALKNGEIDLYPEFTGTGLAVQLGMEAIGGSDEAYRVVSEEFEKQFGIKWLKLLGFYNSYAVAVTDEVYRTYQLETYSDLAAVSEALTFGGEREFFDRKDGYDGLVETYGFRFRGEPKVMNTSLKYEAVGNGGVDVIDVLYTDGPIQQYNLKVLKDDKGYFHAYYAAPVIRISTLEKYPELEEALNLLAGRIDNETMTKLNYRVDVESQDVTAVAAEFLNETGLLKASK